MKCEAEIHSFFCQGEGKTRDHFTPRCLGTLDNLKWVNHEQNFQYLDKQCHAVKDFDTEERLMLKIRQENGEFISLAKYLEEFSFEVVHETEWDEKEFANLPRAYCNRPVELAMILEEMADLSPIDWDYSQSKIRDPLDFLFKKYKDDPEQLALALEWIGF